MNIIRLTSRTVRKFIAKDTLMLGAALAYYAAFSLAPLLLFAVIVAGEFFGEETARGRLTADIGSAVGPEVAEAIEQTLRTARESGSNSTATLIGFVVLLFGAAGVFGQVQSALNRIWEVPENAGSGVWTWFRRRLLAFAMVLGAGFLLLTSLVGSVVLSAGANYIWPDHAAAVKALNQVLAFALQAAAFAVVFKVLPECQVDWASAWLGAGVTAGLFAVGKYLLGLYITVAGVASPYGAAGSLAVILVWVYYASQIFLFGAQFAQVFAELRFEGGDAPPSQT